MTSYSEGPLGSILSDNSGVAWDDGAHDNVQTIRIHYHALGINTVQFDYRDGTKGDEHGNRRPYPETEKMEQVSVVVVFSFLFVSVSISCPVHHDLFLFFFAS